MAAPGSHTFFHKPPVNPNLATLLHCTQISAINFPHCAVARLSAANLPPPPLSLPFSSSCFCCLILPLAFPPSPRFSFLYCLPATAAPFHPSPTYPIASSQSLPDRGPHCHWQTDLNGGIKSIRSNGTRYIRPNENSALRKKSVERLGSTRHEMQNAKISACARVIERHCVKRPFSGGRRENLKYLATT